MEKNNHHKRCLEYGKLINVAALLNPKKSKTTCFSSSDTILIKIPIHLIEGNVKNKVKFLFKEIFLKILDNARNL